MRLGRAPSHVARGLQPAAGHRGPQLRLRLEPLPRRLWLLHADRLARHAGGWMRRRTWAGPRGLGVRLQPAWELGGQTALLAAHQPRTFPASPAPLGPDFGLSRGDCYAEVK